MQKALQTILYIDDDANLLFLLKNAIEKYIPEAKVEAFENITSLLHFLSEHTADLIISDYLIQDYSLTDILDITQNSNLPIIVTSGLMADEIEWPESNRLIGFIQKPFGRHLAAQYIEETWKRNQILSASG